MRIMPEKTLEQIRLDFEGKVIRYLRAGYHIDCLMSVASLEKVTDNPDNYLLNRVYQQSIPVWMVARLIRKGIIVYSPTGDYPERYILKEGY